MKIYYLSRSTRKNKKYMIKSVGDKTIHFGDSRYEDYTIHQNPIRQQMYILRHQKNENFNNLGTAGAWSYNLLWSKPTLKASIKNMERKFGIKLIF